MNTKIDTDAIASSLQRAKELKSELLDLDKAISTLISDVEVALLNLGLGVPLFVSIANDHYHEGLEFDKFGGKWRLLYIEQDGHESVDRTPLSDCSRSLKDSCLRWHVPSLLAEAAQAIEKQIGERRETIQVGNAVVQSLMEATDDAVF